MKASTLCGPGQREISWPPMAGVDKSGGCRSAWQRGRYRERVLLRDGRGVLLRPAHHGDTALLQTLILELSPRKLLLRFHGTVNRLSDAYARTMSTQVASRHVALMALAPPGRSARAKRRGARCGRRRSQWQRGRVRYRRRRRMATG